MTINEMIRRLGGRGGNALLDDKARAFIEEHSKGLEGLSQKELDEMHEKNIASIPREVWEQAFRDADEHRRAAKKQAH